MIMKKRLYILIMFLFLFPIISSATNGSQDLDSTYEYYYSYQYDAIDSIYEQIVHFYNNFQYDDAIKLGKELLSRYSNQTSRLEIIRTYWKLAQCYQNKKEYSHAIELFSKARKYYTGSSYFFRDYDMALLSKEIGDCYYDLGQSEVAIRFYNEIRNPSVLTALSIDFFKVYDYDKSIYYISKAITLLKDNNKYDTDRQSFLRDMALMYEYLSVFYYYKGENKLAYTKIRESLDILYPHILSEFRISTAIERADLWNKYSWAFQTVFPSITYALNNPSSVRKLYDMSALFAKGMLLSTDTEFDRLLLESNDTLAIDAYEELQDLHNQISINQQAAPIPILRNDTLLNELNKQKQELESLLVKYVRSNTDAFGNITQNLQFTWRDVRDKLGPNDIAIEFLSFPEHISDSIVYVALTLRNKLNTSKDVLESSPKMIPLCKESELNAAAKKAYTSNELSHLIWGKLSNELKRDEEKDTVKNIYFSPSGILHQVAIESMPHWENTGSLMSQCYNIYRLSSTRELAIERDSIQSHSAAVYGDIEYNTPVDSMGTPRKVTDQSSSNGKRGFDADSAGYRGKKWDNLRYSKPEINSITSILESKKMNVYKMTKMGATETSFKDLSKQKKNIIHISTHGFCWNDSAARAEGKLSFLGNGLDAMRRSGLLFSGANHCFLRDVTIPDSIDDGVLTAYEVSTLDLRELDLVVLSACETGLGEISAEGVFGLQRGFKKAGARTIIMSLWNVNDLATSDMMTQFYKYWIECGMSKHDAFLKAQGDIKDNDDKYIYDKDKETDKKMRATRPHWAAFILLDAIDN